MEKFVISKEQRDAIVAFFKQLKISPASLDISIRGVVSILESLEPLNDETPKPVQSGDEKSVS